MKNENLELFRKVLNIRGYSESSIGNYSSAIGKYIENKGLDFSEKSLLAYFHEMNIQQAESELLLCLSSSI